MIINLDVQHIGLLCKEQIYIVISVREAGNMKMQCPHCKELHEVSNSEPEPVLQAAVCPEDGNLYLLGMNGKPIDRNRVEFIEKI
jgi:phage FluMu protein Com